MSRLILFRAVASPPARAVMMLGDLVGVQFDMKEVNIIKSEHRTPEFAKLNPMETVPVLQDGDFVISESHAIMKYLLAQYGGDKQDVLYPSDVRARALVDQGLFFNSGFFFPSLRAVGAATFKGAHEPEESHKRSIESSYKVIDAYLEHRRYIATDHVTLADLSVGATASAIQIFHRLDANKFPRCAEWLSRLEAEPVFQKVMIPGAASFAKLMTKMWEVNTKKQSV